MTPKPLRSGAAASQQNPGGGSSRGKGDRGLGRPPGGDGERVRQQLLDAAQNLFLSYEFKAVSVRRIAAEAGVNGAMVNYYFGGKKGLYLAMVDQVFETLERPLRELQQHSGHSVTDFVSAYMTFLSANPWWPNFIIREVLFGEAELRHSVIDRFASTFASGLITAVNDEITSGSYRADLRPELATWSLMGMMVFPFLSRPIAQQILHQTLDENAVQHLIKHTCELFEQGVKNRGNSS